MNEKQLQDEFVIERLLATPSQTKTGIWSHAVSDRFRGTRDRAPPQRPAAAQEGAEVTTFVSNLDNPCIVGSARRQLHHEPLLVVAFFVGGQHKGHQSVHLCKPRARLRAAVEDGAKRPTGIRLHSHRALRLPRQRLRNGAGLTHVGPGDAVGGDLRAAAREVAGGHVVGLGNRRGGPQHKARNLPEHHR